MIEQGTLEWKQLRLGKFTASRFAKLMGNKSTKGYQDEIYRVAYEKKTGNVVESYVNSSMQRGTELEPIARTAYENLKNVFVDEVPFIELNEWVGVSPDGLIDDKGMLEIKCPEWNTHIDYLVGGKLPTLYKWQVQGQLWVAKRDWCDFFSYHPDLEPLLIRVKRDEKLIKQLEERVNEAIEEVKIVMEKI